MGPLQALHTVLPLSFTAGINLYLTVLVIGLSIRFGWVADVAPSMQILASLPVLIAAGVLYVIEFFADKIPYIDNVWDIIHTFVRPVGAILLTVTGLTSFDLAPQWEVIATLVAGAVALTSHSGKAGTRTAVNVSSPAENLSNIIISLLEDVLVAVLAFLALQYPTTANVIALVLLALIIVLVPHLLRWTWFTLQAVFASLRGLVHQIKLSDRLPPELAALLNDQQPALTLRCRAQAIRNASGYRGYLALHQGQVVFVYRRWFRPQCWQIELAQVGSVVITPRLLFLVLTVAYQEHDGTLQTARFAITKDRTQLAQQFAHQLMHESSARRNIATPT
jgi:hypothetical protein